MGGDSPRRRSVGIPQGELAQLRLHPGRRNIRLSAERRLLHHLGRNALEALRRIGGLTLSRHFLHGAHIQLDQQRLFPFREHPGAHRRNIGRRERQQFAQHFRGSDFAGERQHDFLVVGIPAERGMGHHQMPMHQKRHRPALRIVQPQSRRHLIGDAPSDFAMILFLALPEVVEKHREMEQILALDLAIHFTQHPLILPEGFHFRDRQQAVLVDGVLMILIELHQPPHRRAHGNQLLQQMRAVHRFQGGGGSRPG